MPLGFVVTHTVGDCCVVEVLPEVGCGIEVLIEDQEAVGVRKPAVEATWARQGREEGGGPVGESCPMPADSGFPAVTTLHAL